MSRAPLDPQPRSDADPPPPARTDSGLDLRRLLGLAWRTLPYLKPVVRELRPLAIVATPLFILAVPATMLGTDLVLTRMLGGEPLTATQATVLGLDPLRFVEVEQLDVAARREIRSLVARALLVSTLVVTPLLVWGLVAFVRVQQRVNQILRVEMVEHVHAMSMRFHDQARIGDSVYRAYQDSAMVTNLMSMLVRPIGPVFMAVTGVLLATLFDPRIPLALLALYAGSFLLARWYTPRLKRGFRVARESNSALTATIQEALVGARVIKAYGSEDLEQARFEAASWRAFRGAFGARMKLASFGIFAFTLAAIPPMGAAAALAVRAREGGSLSGGAALALVGFAVWNLGAYGDATRRVGSWAAAARVLMNMWGRAQDMAVGMERAFDHVDLSPDVQNAPDAIAMPRFTRSIVFDDVSFRYLPEQPTLQHIHLEARVGTITALVGPTGSGKSTLMSLLLRLFDPDSGRIEIDGIDLRRIDLESLRAHVSIALQENLLFGSSIRENIRYAQSDATDAQVEAAARIACAHDFIRAQPQGYDTRLGERGAKLSTGQRQRISIARALVKDASILILDEPTASLDAETELQVMTNLARWGRGAADAEGRAIFIATHRLSTVRRADQIVYLSEGRILETGAPDDLLARKDGAYRRFVEIEREMAGGDAA